MALDGDVGYTKPEMRFLKVFSAMVLLGAAPNHVYGQDKAKGDIAAIAEGLGASDEVAVRAAIDDLGATGSPKIIPPLTEFLLSGRPDTQTDRAIEVIGVLGHPDGIDVLSRFTRHRRESARREAYKALIATKGPVRSHLERGLSDSDRSIRAMCATALGEVGAQASLEPLFRAFDRGVVQAATSIGKIGNVKALHRYNQYLEKRPLGTLLSGYREFLLRKDIPLKEKDKLVDLLGEVSSPMVRRFLQRYLQEVPSKASFNRHRKHVEKVILRIPVDMKNAKPRPQTKPQGSGDKS